jgi:uncharacterized ubiquitin-like protein YukD
MIEREFDILIPIVKKVGTVKKLIISIVEENTENVFKDNGCLFLYDKRTGNVIDDDAFVSNSGIKNGTKLILY